MQIQQLLFYLETTSRIEGVKMYWFLIEYFLTNDMKEAPTEPCACMMIEKIHRLLKFMHYDKRD